MDVSSLPPHVRMMILGHTDQKVREEVLKVRTEPGVEAVALFSRLSAHVESNAPNSAINTLFSDDELRCLETRGYIVKDNFSSADLSELKKEVTNMKTSGTLKSASMNTSALQTWNDPSIRGDLHHWLSEDKERTEKEKPQLAALLRSMDDLRVELNDRCGFNSSKTQTQIALYPGGGARYIRHLDSVPGGADRRLTCLFYLNEDWKPENGGSLRVFLPNTVQSDTTSTNTDDAGEIEVDIEPLWNRLVIFQSRTIPHEVLPAFTDRMAITMWFY